VTGVERMAQRRTLIELRARIENIIDIRDRTRDPEEQADCVILINLYSRWEWYLESEFDLPNLEEAVRQFSGITLPPLGVNSSSRRNKEEAELKLLCAKRAIEDWKRLEPEWHEIYADIKARIDARTAAKTKSLTPEEDIPIELKETIPADLGRFIDSLWKGEHLADSINSRTAAFRLAQGIIHNGKPLNSETLRTNTIKPSSSKKS
jgi:hypothetical protein